MKNNKMKQRLLGFLRFLAVGAVYFTLKRVLHLF